MSMTRLRMGMGDSYGLRITVLASDSFDPEAPSGATFHVTKPDASEVTWTATIASQSAVSALATYAFNADGTDLDQAGIWRVWIQWTVTGESPGPRSEVGSFNVIAANQK